MRKDISKVIVERPRLGRSAAGKKPGRTQALYNDFAHVLTHGARGLGARVSADK